MSRHLPIFVKLRFGALPVRKVASSAVPRRPAWSRASQQNTALYIEALQARQQDLTVTDSVHCQDPSCDNKSHSADCDSLLDVLCAIVESSSTTIPLSGGGKAGQGRTARGGVPGWEEEVPG